MKQNYQASLFIGIVLNQIFLAFMTKHQVNFQQNVGRCPFNKMYTCLSMTMKGLPLDCCSLTDTHNHFRSVSTIQFFLTPHTASVWARHSLGQVRFGMTVLVPSERMISS